MLALRHEKERTPILEGERIKLRKWAAEEDLAIVMERLKKRALCQKLGGNTRLDAAQTVEGKFILKKSSPRHFQLNTNKQIF